MEDLSAFSARPRLAALLDHFAEIADTRQSWKVMYPLREVLFLLVCGTIASGDDYDDIVDWGKAHLAFLRGFAEFPARPDQRLGKTCTRRLSGYLPLQPSSEHSAQSKSVIGPIAFWRGRSR